MREREREREREIGERGHWREGRYRRDSREREREMETERNRESEGVRLGKRWGIEGELEMSKGRER